VAGGLLGQVRPLGKLEQRVMNVVWDGDAFTVREVMARLEPEPAYTTVMTTLDRLFKKKLLARAKDGAAFVYRAAMSRDDYHHAVVEGAVGGLLERATGPVLAAFVDTAAKLDEDNLRRLERLIEAHRKGRSKR
jgi:predicted transcriptional regulator